MNVGVSDGIDGVNDGVAEGDDGIDEGCDVSADDNIYYRIKKTSMK